MLQVQAVIRACPDEQGISVTSIAQKMRGLPPQSLKSVVLTVFFQNNNSVS